ncbi:MAG: hypothetical protein V2A73_22500 [Pseudomonadota bacterium]
MLADAGSPESAVVVDVRRVVALGERIASAGNEHALAEICAGALRTLLSTTVAIYASDELAVANGVTMSDDVLAAFRRTAIRAIGFNAAATFVPAALLPTEMADCLAGLDGISDEIAVAPLRAQREIVGAIGAVFSGDRAKLRELLSAVAQQTSSALAAIRAIESARAHAREIESLLANRTSALRVCEARLAAAERAIPLNEVARKTVAELVGAITTLIPLQTQLTTVLAQSNHINGVALAEARLICDRMVELANQAMIPAERLVCLGGGSDSESEPSERASSNGSIDPSARNR